MSVGEDDVFSRESALARVDVIVVVHERRLHGIPIDRDAPAFATRPVEPLIIKKCVPLVAGFFFLKPFCLIREAAKDTGAPTDIIGKHFGDGRWC